MPPLPRVLQLREEPLLLPQPVKPLLRLLLKALHLPLRVLLRPLKLLRRLPKLGIKARSNADDNNPPIQRQR